MSNILTKEQVNNYSANGFIHPVSVISSIKANFYAKQLLLFQSNHPEYLQNIKARKLHLILTWMTDFNFRKTYFRCCRRSNWSQYIMLVIHIVL